MKKIEIEMLQYINDRYTNVTTGNALDNGSFNFSLGNTGGVACSSCPSAAGYGQVGSSTQNNPSTTGNWGGWRSSNQVGGWNNGTEPYISGGNLHLTTLVDVITPWPFPGSGNIAGGGVYQTVLGMTPGQVYTLEIDIVSLPSGASANDMNGCSVILGIPGNQNPGWINHGYSTTSGNPVPQANDPTSVGSNSQGCIEFDWNTPLVVGTNLVNFVWDTGSTAGILSLFAYGNTAMGGHAAGQEVVISEMRLNATTTTSYQAVTNASVVGKLDLTDSKNFPLALTLGVADGSNFEKIFGDYSKTFQVPATKNNQKLLGHINNPLVIDEKNITAFKDCRIIADGIETIRGKLKVTGVNQKKKVNFYDCVFYGGNADWGSQIKDKRMCDLDMQLGDGQGFYGQIEYIFSKIIGSWSLDQTTSDVVYPLVSYGNFYPDGPCGCVNTADTEGESQDWRYWIYVYNILENIFKATGYTMSSNFMTSNGAWFKRLATQLSWAKNDYDNLGELCYLRWEGYSNGVDWSGTDGNCNTDLLCNVGAGVNTNGDWKRITGTPTKPGIQVKIKIKDDFGQFSSDQYTGAATGEITIAREGKVMVTAMLGFALGFFECGSLGSQPNYGMAGQCFMRLRHNGSLVASGNTPLINCGANFNGYVEWTSLEIETQWMSVSVGDKIWLEAKADSTYLSGQGNNSNQFSVCALNKVTIAGESFIEMKFDGSNIYYGDQFQLKDAMPCDVMQSTFLKAVSHMFNLYFYTDVTAKIVYIEPYDDFYQGPSKGIDWTTKVDWSKSIQDKFDIGLKNEILFKYKKDGKDKYQNWINDEMVTGSYPLFSYYSNLGTMFEDGLKKFENPLFSGTVMEYDKDTSGYVTSDTPNLIPVMEKEVTAFGTTTDPCVGRPDKDTFAPRIMLYDGLTTDGAGGTNRWTRTTNPSGSTVSTSATYPRGVFVDVRQTSTLFQDRINLSYNDEIHDDGDVIPGLVSNYWSNMLLQLMDKPRTRTMYINLKLKDILTLDLTRLIYIDGSWWRLIKVMDFAPAKNETTKVKLIQWIDVSGSVK